MGTCDRGLLIKRVVREREKVISSLTGDAGYTAVDTGLGYHFLWSLLHKVAVLMIKQSDGNVSLIKGKQREWSRFATLKLAWRIPFPTS